MKNKNKSYKKALKYINQVQKIRSKNNINWMNVLRLAFKHDPNEAAKLMKKINSDDGKIGRVLRKLEKI
tara:strand:- start:1778 stop:1984 length:207 start_codon:yes stop_codon:yes gene_type:complete